MSFIRFVQIDPIIEKLYNIQPVFGVVFDGGPIRLDMEMPQYV